LVKKRPRIGIVPRVTLGTAAAMGVIPACVAISSCSSSSGQVATVAAAFDSSFECACQGYDVLGAFDTTLPETSSPDEAGSDADDATSGDGGFGEADAPTGDGPISDASDDGG
jgi:hypothetical protein